MLYELIHEGGSGDRLRVKQRYQKAGITEKEVLGTDCVPPVPEVDGQ